MKTNFELIQRLEQLLKEWQQDENSCNEWLNSFGHQQESVIRAQTRLDVINTYRSDLLKIIREF